MLRLLQEGSVEFYSHTGKISSKLPVFYNPDMKLARDVSVDIARNLNPKDACCVMDASGVRSLRIWKEAGVEDVTANDISPEACRLMKRNFGLNDAGIKISESDANDFLGCSVEFGYIDLDPFGSPVKFLDSVCSKVRCNGIVAVAATDIGCLAGRYRDTCMRRYSVRSMPAPFSKELAVRILISKVQEAGAKHGKSLVPVFVHYTKHYIRVYLQDSKTDVASMQGFVFFCRKCLRWHSSKSPVASKCKCGEVMDWAGPLWIGKLWDSKFVNGIIPHVKEESGVDGLGFYDLHRFAKALGLKSIPKITDVMSRIRSLGFSASRTHFTPVGIRSDMPYENFVGIIS